jgi:hypothetical protein
MDRVGFFRNGWLIDDVLFSASTLEFRRAGEARFEVRVENHLAGIDLALWTTRRGPLRTNPSDGPPPDWLRVRVVGDSVDSLVADSVDVHFEHLDRNNYYLGVAKLRDHWMLDFAGAGYLKLAPLRHRSPQLAELHIDVAASAPELRDALAIALRVVPSRLLLTPVDELAERPSRPGDIVVTVTPREGDFPQTLGFRSTEQELPIAARLTETLRCRALLADRTPDPYAWTLVTSDGSIIAAQVDQDALERNEALVLTGAG